MDNGKTGQVTMIELVGLDADDTLWHNEPLYTGCREQFQQMLLRYVPESAFEDRLHAVEMRNLSHFGYGVKGFVLSMIETAIELTGGRITSADIAAIIDWGRQMLGAPIELLEGVREAVEALSERYSIILVTKGDLLHQETKLARSGLGHMFRGIEIVSEKDPAVYRRVMDRYAVQPDRFVMVGNSLRSDILPVIEAGAHAVYVPYSISWVHERVPPEALVDIHFHEIPHLRELPRLLATLRT
jgi:putative hydrolase of the HAD superfamily